MIKEECLEDDFKEELDYNNIKSIEKFYLSNDNFTIDNFAILKNNIDKIITNMLSNFDLDEINEQCEVDCEIKGVTQEEYCDKITFIAEYSAYFARKYKELGGYLKTYNSYVDILKMYLFLMSGKKKAEFEPEAAVRLREYYIKKNYYENVLAKIEGKKDAFDIKYTALSRVLSFWKEDNVLNKRY